MKNEYESTMVVRVGELTENECYVVIDWLTEIIVTLGGRIGEITKPKPMYRDVEIIGSLDLIWKIGAVMTDCEVINR